MAIDGSSTGNIDKKVTRETKTLPIIIQQYYKEISFDIINMASYNIILEILWLNLYNFSVDWKTRTMKFERCGCTIITQSTQWQSPLANEEVKKKNPPLIKNKRLLSVFINAIQSQDGYEIKNKKEDNIFFEIFE